MKNCIGILSATEKKENLRKLTTRRAIASLPFAGKYRVVDFMLSNMVNSGLKSVEILTETDSRSLRDNISSGAAWDLNRRRGGLFLFHDTRSQPYSNDIQILKDNFEYLEKSSEEYVIFASTYFIVNIDLKETLDAHIKSEKDITIIYKKIDDASECCINCDTLKIINDEVEEIGKNKGDSKEANISMEIFIMKKELLVTLIEKSAYIDYARNLKSMIYENIKNYKINLYEHKGYLGCISSLNSYYKTNMDMLDEKISQELFFNEKRPIFSKSKDSTPTKYSLNSRVSRSLISNGCEIKGRVKGSVISRMVKIEEGAVVENSIIMQGCVIKSGCLIKNVIIDKNVVLKEGTELQGSSIYPLVIEKAKSK